MLLPDQTCPDSQCALYEEAKRLLAEGATLDDLTPFQREAWLNIQAIRHGKAIRALIVAEAAAKPGSTVVSLADYRSKKPRGL